jgi:hypothetical protein
MALAEMLSVTRAVKVSVPAAVGVPVIAPVPPRVNPEGSDPEIKAQV